MFSSLLWIASFSFQPYVFGSHQNFRNDDFILEYRARERKMAKVRVRTVRVVARVVARAAARAVARRAVARRAAKVAAKVAAKMVRVAREKEKDLM